ncbi:MAG: D-alanyl-D-alanine carboxypeptidase [Clostridia bacterium]|nr:D-alanyl-D-alanine carboxypeptidase [Clostridia bacterium]
MLIKKIIYIPILVCLVFVLSLISYSVDISAECAVVINSVTNEIIFEKNAFKKHSMASTTKMMTSILAIESGRLGNTITVTEDALAEGSSIGLKPGYKLTLEALVYGMMLESGNDAANVCALSLGETFDRFSLFMNEKAEDIGMANTNFVTPSGLDNEAHYSTAYDMALLGAYCIKNPVFRNICSTKNKKIDFITPDISETFSNHNKLLDSCQGVFGIKTGFTKKSGRCLVSACERDGVTLVCVTLNAGDDWNDHRKLYDLSFTEINKSTVRFTDISEVSVYGADTDKTEIYCNDFVYSFKDKSKLTKQIIMPKIIYAPIEKNEIIGKVNYYSDKTLVHTAYIHSKNAVSASEERIKDKFSIVEYFQKFFQN